MTLEDAREGVGARAALSPSIDAVQAALSTRWTLDVAAGAARAGSALQGRLRCSAVKEAVFLSAPEFLVVAAHVLSRVGSMNAGGRS